MNEFTYAVDGGEIGDDVVESIRHLNYNAVFAHGAKALQGLSQVVQAQQVQTDELQTTIQNHLLMNSATIIS